MKYLLEGEETDRLEFRLLRPSDFDTWQCFFENTEASGYLAMQHIGSPKDQCTEWFNKVMHRYTNDLGGMNVLIDKQSKEFIGQCGLLVQEVDDLEELEIGYSILPQFWSRGYAAEAAIKCRDFAFEHNFSESLISIIHKDNVRSEKVAIKNGMKNSSQTFFHDMPVNIFRIYKTDWERKNS